MLGLLSGEAQAKVDVYTTSINHVKAGKLKLLAVTSPVRMEILPDVPTIAESGYPGYSSSYFMGVMGPKGLPEQIRSVLEKTVIKSVKDDRISKRLISDGVRPLAGTGSDLSQLLKKEIAEWAKVIKENNIRAD